MRFPLISILPIIDEVKSELKRITKMSSFSDEDMYGWAIDAARLIGQTCYEDSEPLYLTVSKNAATVPSDFYLLQEISLCQPKSIVYSTTEIPAGQEPIRWIKTSVLCPADQATRKLCVPGCRHGSDSTLSYKIKCPPGIIRFSFQTGKVCIVYKKLTKNNEGEILIQDEPNSLIAIKNYIITTLLKEAYILREVDRIVYKDFESLWDKYKELAQQQFKFPSPDETRYMALKQDARFRTFRYKNP